MSIGKKIESFVKSLVLAPRIYARYGSLRPTKVKLIRCDHWVHIDPTDRRATKKFVQDPLRGRVSPPSAFWNAFNKHLQPAVAVDVGVNFGECLFAVRYAERTRIFGFEANPRIAPFLEKSRQEHPDGSRMTLTHGLVSDEAAEDIPFFVNPTWSGGASAVAALNDEPGTLSFKLSARTLDSVIPRDLVQNQSLLFKMDIEGYESRAFGGFWQTIDAAAFAVGFIEFDSSYITAAGESPEAYFHRLEKRFDIYRLDPSAKQVLLEVGNYSTLPISRAADGRVHTDLILVTPETPASSWLAPGWSIR
jgi:FkbM family methyltransferase